MYTDKSDNWIVKLSTITNLLQYVKDTRKYILLYKYSKKINMFIKNMEIEDYEILIKRFEFIRYFY